MPKKSFVSRASVRAQVDLITLTGTADAGDTVSATINSRSETYTLITGDTLTTAAAGLAAACAASQNPEFQEITWTSSGAVVTATANTPGRSFELTASASGLTATRSASVANSSPGDVSLAANWSGGSLPATGDDLFFESSTIAANSGLGAVTFDAATITVRESFAGPIALPVYNDRGYYEYRGTTFRSTVNCTLVVEESPTAQAGHYKFSFTSDVVTATVSNVSGIGSPLGSESVWLTGTAANSVLNVYGGSVLVAPLAEDTATLTTVRVIDGTLRCTAGVTLSGATITQDGGVVDVTTAVSTWSINGAQAEGYCRGEATIGTLSVDAGTVFHLSTGTITTLKVGSGATVDFSGVLGGVTVTNCEVAAEATILDPGRRVTFTNGIKLNRCSLAEVTLDLGTHLTLTPSAY